jgi:FAD/FMN-containing dehydrogenase
MVLAVYWTAPDLAAIPSTARNRPCLFVLACHVGPADAGEPVIRPLRELAPRVADLTARMPWVKVQQFFDEDYPAGLRYYWKSTFVPELTDGTLSALHRHTLTRPSPLTSIDVWSLGGAFARVPPGETAFGRRDEAFLVNYEANWIRDADDGANIAWARQSLREIEAMSTARTYLNFAGLAEEGRTLVEQSFGDSYERLRRVKRRHDPDNLFRGNFNIAPAD